MVPKMFEPLKFDCIYFKLSSRLLVCAPAKVMERVAFKQLYNHFNGNNVITPLKSGYIPGDSTTNQSTNLYDTFCQAHDSGKEVRVVFCDISKTFDRVWHTGLLHKLQADGVLGNFLTNRKKRVVLPGRPVIMELRLCLCTPYCEGYRIKSSRKHAYIILTPLNPTFI